VIVNPGSIYAVLGDFHRDDAVIEQVDPDSPLGRELLEIAKPIGTAPRCELAYWPHGSNREQQLSNWPNSHAFHILGDQCGRLHLADHVISHNTELGPTVIAHFAFDEITTPVSDDGPRHIAPVLDDDPGDPNLIMVRDWIDPALCLRIVNSLDQAEVAYGNVLTDPYANTNAFDQSVRVVRTMQSNKPAIVKRLLRNIVIDLAEPFFNVQMDFWNQPVLCKYETGGFFLPHVDGENWKDGEWFRIYDRDYTMVAFLNDDYAGGDLVFPGMDYRVTPKTGRVCIFPGSHHYRHGAETVTDGQRYQLVSWLTAVGTPRTNIPPHTNVIYRASRSR
jgi:predicted 2-oxoglutarate/Fe(II)-dependent dioxygenase YbiX